MASGFGMVGRDRKEFVSYTPPGGQPFSFNAWGWSVLSIRGLGPLPPEYITEAGPLGSGVVIRGHRLPARVIDIELWQHGKCRDDYWDKLGALSTALSPHRGGPGLLSITLASGEVREALAYIAAPPDVSWGGQTLRAERRHGLRFVCPSPVFSEGKERSVTFDPRGASPDELAFPVSFPIQFSGSVYLVGAAQVIQYGGTVPSKGRIVITGPLLNPSITNGATGEVISLAYRVAEGEVVTIDLDYMGQGLKRAISSTVGDITGYSTNPHGLAAWAIVPDPQAPGGYNVIIPGGSEARISTSFQLTYSELYTGVPK